MIMMPERIKHAQVDYYSRRPTVRRSLRSTKGYAMGWESIPNHSAFYVRPKHPELSVAPKVLHVKRPKLEFERPTWDAPARKTSLKK